MNPDNIMEIPKLPPTGDPLIDVIKKVTRHGAEGNALVKLILDSRRPIPAMPFRDGTEVLKSDLNDLLVHVHKYKTKGEDLTEFAKLFSTAADVIKFIISE